MRNWIPILMGVFLVIIMSGCSGGSPGPVVPGFDSPGLTGASDTTGHSIWGAWEFEVNPDTLDVTVQKMRNAEIHFDVTSFLIPPSCVDCINLEVIDVDLSQFLFSVRVILKNPTPVNGFDVRGIVHVKSGQQLVNADNWTALYDIPDDMLRNPFQAFAKEKASRAFVGGSSGSATYRLVLPPGNMAVSYVVEASYPDNCPEPYEMKIINGIDFLADNAVYSDMLKVTVNDWQGDIAYVQLDMASLGVMTPLDLTKSGDLWQVQVTNSGGAAPGFYTAWLQTASTMGPVLYEPIEIEVKSFGQDRLPEVLGLMHNWDSGGNPNEQLDKTNFKYEGSDLNSIIPDMFQENTGYSARLPYYDSIHRNALSTVPYMTGLLDNIEIQTDPPSLYGLLKIASQQLGEEFTDSTFGFTPPASPIADAMSEMYTDIGQTLSASDYSAIQTGTSSLPIDLQLMTAAILMSVGEGYEYRQDAISPYSQEIRDILFDNGTDWMYGSSIYFAVIQEACNFDYPNMYRSAGPVCQAIDGMRNMGLYYVPQASDSWEFDTPIGLVKIGSSDTDTYGSDEYLLILDPGGNDTYTGPAAANASQNNPYSICIDLAGDDDYTDNSAYAYGAGRLGTAIHWDVYGDDSYDNNRFTQGFGHWGVGILMDSAGNDQYNADGCSQGSGYMGVGILIDEWGHDTYDCYQYSQGFGFVKGWGLAYDEEGNDRWTANDTNIIYPGPQTDQHNTSMSQGQGYGMRWDTQMTFISGGQGILFDKYGDDEYSCGVFGGACAYWFGTGILADYGGTDTRHGIWYVYSGTAHYGTSFLLDKGDGNDSYTATTGVGIGGGHDFSNSFLLDEGGNDTYSSAPHSLGGGNECGIGVIVDYAGDDNYLTTHTGSMGNGYFSDGRNRGSWGVFLDLGGTDTYAVEKQAQGCNNNTTWTINDIGAGGDYEGGIVIWQ